ncbi:MAG: N-acetyl-gamma-glutamyl-phosphate reductase [Chitinophagales bacterium]
MSDQKLKVAIVGASGFTGSELARLLLFHPLVEIVAITSESHSGKRFSDLHPQFCELLDMNLVPADQMPESKPDAVFLALPHGVSMHYIEKWKAHNFRIIDLSGDYRLSDKSVYENWYKKEHTFPEAFENAVYGLPELHKEKVKNAKLVANPGCYPTASILALAPLFSKGWVKADSVIIDAKSGTTGAGIKASPTTLFSNVNDNFKAYGIKSHRHTVEIQEQLGGLVNANIDLQFTPHLLPLDRGILVSAYASPEKPVNQEVLTELYKLFYKEHPFVRIRKEAPTLKDVRSSNFCDIYPVWDKRTNRIMIFSAIDNLMKGAAGQAVQNLNIMYGFNENAGLEIVPLKP